MADMKNSVNLKKLKVGSKQADDPFDRMYSWTPKHLIHWILSVMCLRLHQLSLLPPAIPVCRNWIHQRWSVEGTGGYLGRFCRDRYIPWSGTIQGDRCSGDAFDFLIWDPISENRKRGTEVMYMSRHTARDSPEQRLLRMMLRLPHHHTKIWSWSHF